MDDQPRYRTHIAVEEIQPSPTNPRKHFDETSLAELAASIKEHGLITPILIRHSDGPTSCSNTLYELISGERRWRAAQIAGLHTIPAVIRDDLSPAAIIEIQLIENLQRADLHPLEEAEGYGRMMREHGYTADLLAEKIGKSRSYIFGRMKLLDLDEEGRRLFYGGLLNPSTALLIARIPSRKLQAKAIEDITRKDYNGDVPSVREAQRTIRNRYMLALDKAPFPTEDGELIATAGPCSACPKRTGNNPDLFDDVDSANVCTDPDCHTAKKLAASERRAKEAGPDVTVVTGEEAEKIMPSYAAESRTHAKLDSICYEDPQHRTYREIIGDDAKAITLVENQNKGELVPVVAKKVVNEKLKAQGVVTRAMESRDENKKIKAQVTLENAWREAMFKSVRESAHAISSNLTMLDALIYVVTRRFLIDAGNSRAENVAGLWGAIGVNSFDRAEAFRKGMANYTTDEQLRICLDLALLAELKTDEYNLQRKPEGMLAMAEALGIDANALLKQAKESQKPGAKSKKTTKTAPPETAEDHLPPSEAAQARDVLRVETQSGALNFVGCSGVVDFLPEGDPDRRFFAIEAAPAGDQSQPENPTAVEQSCAADAAVEKPSEAGDLPFGIGDRVQYIGEEFLMVGCLGRVTACFYDGHCDVQFDTLFSEMRMPFTDIKLIEKAPSPDGEAIETDAKPSPANRHTIQYQHPENDELCWSGRGRKPKWVEHWIAAGKTLDQLKIGAAA